MAEKYVEEKPIIYIGKTESSQSNRDEKTHFSSGKSGSSTVRRTLGAILRTTLSLTPIPRSLNEKSDRKFKNYKFNESSEEQLTLWMVNNLALSFWEFEGTRKELREIEKQLIQNYIPVLNLSLNSNSANPHKSIISALRAECKNLARLNERLA